MCTVDSFAMATPANWQQANGRHRSRLSSKPSALCSANYFLATASAASDREDLPLEARRRLAIDGRVVQQMVSNSGGNHCSEADDLQKPSEAPRRVTFSAGGASEPQQAADGENLPPSPAPVAGSGRFWRGAAASICAGQRLQSLERHVAEIKQRQEIHTELKAWVQQVLSSPEPDNLLMSEQDDSDSPSVDCSEAGNLQQVHQHHEDQISQQHGSVQPLAQVVDCNMQHEQKQQQLFGTTSSLKQDRQFSLSGVTAGLVPVNLNSLPPIQHETAAAQPVAVGAAHSPLDTEQLDAASWQQPNASEQRLIQQLKSDQQMLLEQLQQAYQQVAELTAAQLAAAAAAASATASAVDTLEHNNSHASCKQESGGQETVRPHNPDLACQSAGNCRVQFCASNSTRRDVESREDSGKSQNAQTLQPPLDALQQHKLEVPQQRKEEQLQPRQKMCQPQQSKLLPQQQQQEHQQQDDVVSRCHEQDNTHSGTMTEVSSCRGNVQTTGNHRHSIQMPITTTPPEGYGADTLSHPQRPVSCSLQSTPPAGAGSKTRHVSSSMHAAQQPVSSTLQLTPRSRASTANAILSSAKHAARQPVSSTTQPTPRSRASTTNAQHAAHQPISSSPHTPSSGAQPVRTGVEKPKAVSHKAATHPETSSRSSMSKARHSGELPLASQAGRVTGRGLSVEQQQALVDRLHHAEQVMQLLQQDLHAALEAQQALQQQLQQQHSCSNSAVVNQQQGDCDGECEAGSGTQRQQGAVQQDRVCGEQALRPDAGVTQVLAQDSDAAREVVSCVQHTSQQGPDLDEPHAQLPGHQQEQQEHLVERVQQQGGDKQQELQQPADACTQQRQDVTPLQQQQQQQPSGVEQPQLQAEQALVQLAGDLLQMQAEAQPTGSAISACCHHESRCHQLQAMLQALVAQVQALEQSTRAQSKGSNSNPEYSPRRVVRSAWQHRPIALHTWLCPPPSSPRQNPQASLPAMLTTSMPSQKDPLDMSTRPRQLPTYQACQASTSQQPCSTASGQLEEVMHSRHLRDRPDRPQAPLSARYPSMTAPLMKHDGDGGPLDSRLRSLTYRGPDRTQSSAVDMTFGTKHVSVDAEHGLLASLRVAPLSARRQHQTAAHTPRCAGRQQCPSSLPQKCSHHPARHCLSAKYSAARTRSAGPAVGWSSSSHSMRSQQQCAARNVGHGGAGMQQLCQAKATAQNGLAGGRVETHSRTGQHHDSSCDSVKAAQCVVPRLALSSVCSNDVQVCKAQ